MFSFCSGGAEGDGSCAQALQSHAPFTCDGLQARRDLNLGCFPPTPPPAPSVEASVVLAAFSGRLGRNGLGSSGLIANPADLMASRIDLPPYSLGTCCLCSPGRSPDSPWGPESLAETSVRSPAQDMDTVVLGHVASLRVRKAEGPHGAGRGACV